MNNKNEQEIIYHYCSMESFLKIIETRRLRFSDALKTNDSKEIIYLWNIAKNSPKLSGCEKYSFEYFMDICNILYLILCFTECEDDLHMWLEYGKGGFSIGFDRQEIQKWLYEISQNGNHFSFPAIDDQVKLKKVDYLSRQDIQDKVNCIFNCKNMDDAFHTFLDLAPTVKEKSWEIEKEYRAMLKMHLSNTSMVDCELDQYHVDAYPKEDDFLLYCDIPFCYSMIKKIIMAPDNKISKQELKQYLYLKGFPDIDDNMIEKSELGVR